MKISSHPVILCKWGAVILFYFIILCQKAHKIWLSGTFWVFFWVGRESIEVEITKRAKKTLKHSQNRK